ncbi:MAG: hypothetical protein GY927_10945, partial [bacterium]|nr:hypothetical protein [bacterium]
TPVRISQHGVEVAWQKYTTIEDAEGFTYTLDGHIYCVWTFPTANKTWEYDVTAQQWHERESYPYKAWRTKWAMNAYDKVLCGDRDSGKYGYLDPGAYDEFSDPLLMRWTYPTVYAEKNLAFHHELELHCETGVGNANDTDPVVMIEVSDDGGRVWDHLPTVEIGAIGEYRQVITWTGLGSSADRVYRGSISAKVQRSVIQTHLRVTGGNF